MRIAIKLLAFDSIPLQCTSLWRPSKLIKVPISPCSHPPAPISPLNLSTSAVKADSDVQSTDTTTTSHLISGAALPGTNSVFKSAYFKPEGEPHKQLTPTGERATKHVVENTGDGILSTQLEEQASTANIANKKPTESVVYPDTSISNPDLDYDMEEGSIAEEVEDSIVATIDNDNHNTKSTTSADESPKAPPIDISSDSDRVFLDTLAQCHTIECLTRVHTMPRSDSIFNFPHFMILGFQKSATTSLFK